MAYLEPRSLGVTQSQRSLTVLSCLITLCAVRGDLEKM